MVGIVEGATRSVLRDLTVAAIIAANTPAASRVYSPRSWPQRPDQFPVAMVTAPSERKESLGRAVPQFNSTITIAVMVRVRGSGADSLSMTADAEAQLEMLCSNIEAAVLCSASLLSRVQQFSFVETQMTLNVESEAVLGEGTIIFGCEVYQSFETDLAEPMLHIDATFERTDGRQLASAAIDPPQ